MEFQSFIKELITTNEPPAKTEGQKIVFTRLKNGFFTTENCYFLHFFTLTFQCQFLTKVHGKISLKSAHICYPYCLTKLPQKES